MHIPSRRYLDCIDNYGSRDLIMVENGIYNYYLGVDNNYKMLNKLFEDVPVVKAKEYKIKVS